MSSVADELSPAGWPRPWLLWTPPADGPRAQALPRILPVAWINGAHPYHGDWVTFDEARTLQALDQQLCAVCGQPLNRITLLARAGDSSTSAAGCHPRCMHLTVTACPHFTDPTDATRAGSAVAWRAVDAGLGDPHDRGRRTSYADRQAVAGELPELTARDVQALASVDPWGTGRPETMDADETVADD